MPVPPAGPRPEASSASSGEGSAPRGASRPGETSRWLRALRMGLVGFFVLLFATPLGGVSWGSAKVFFGLWALAVVSIALAHARSGAED